MSTTAHVAHGRPVLHAVLVHGVGDHDRERLGEIRDRVAVKLREVMPGSHARIGMETLNWQAAMGVRQGMEAYFEAVTCLIRSAFRSRPEPSRLNRLESVGLVLAELGVAGALAALFCVPLVEIAAATIRGMLRTSGTIDRGWIWWAVKTGIATSVLGAAVGLLTGLIRTVHDQDTTHLWSTLRASLLIALRPVLAVPFWCSALPWPAWIPLSLGLLALLAGFGVSRPYLWAVGGCLAAWSLGRVVRPFLGVVLDIFRYISDRSVRNTLTAQLAGMIDSAPQGCQHVVVVAHSLGSVIAVDALQRGLPKRPVRRITLVTMGSPLARYLMRFFPGQIFPPNAPLALEVMREHYPGLRWVNAHRPWDQIGGRLGLRGSRRAIDVNTEQWFRTLSAHVDYWSDRVVASAVIRGLRRIGGHVQRLRNHDVEAAPTLKLGWILIVALLTYLASGLAGVGLYAWRYRSFVDQGIARYESLRDSGTPVPATVRARSETVRHPRGPDTKEWKLDIDYEAGGQPRKSTLDLAYSTAQDFWIDLDALLAACRKTEGPLPFEIRVDADDPDTFVVPGFAPRRGTWDWIGSLFEILVASVFLLTMTGLVYVAIVGSFLVPLFWRVGSGKTTARRVT